MYIPVCAKPGKKNGWTRKAGAFGNICDVVVEGGVLKASVIWKNGGLLGNSGNTTWRGTDKDSFVVLTDRQKRARTKLTEFEEWLPKAKKELKTFENGMSQDPDVKEFGKIFRSYCTWGGDKKSKIADDCFTAAKARLDHAEANYMRRFSEMQEEMREEWNHRTAEIRGLEPYFEDLLSSVKRRRLITRLSRCQSADHAGVETLS